MPRLTNKTQNIVLIHLYYFVNFFKSQIYMLKKTLFSSSDVSFVFVRIVTNNVRRLASEIHEWLYSSGEK